MEKAKESRGEYQLRRAKIAVKTLGTRVNTHIAAGDLEGALRTHLKGLKNIVDLWILGGHPAIKLRFPES